MPPATAFGDVDIGQNLRPLLVSNEIVDLNTQYQTKDAQAAAAQASLMTLLWWTNVLVLLIALFSGLVLAMTVYRGDLPAEWADQGTRWLAGAVGLLTIIASVLGQFARDGDRIGRWQRLRAEAELARSGRFVAAARAAAAAGKPAAAEALALLRNGLLQDQRDWYARRAEQHRRHGRITSGWKAAALLLTAMASAGAIAVTFAGLNNVLLLIGVFAAAFSAFAADRESLYRDHTNAELYEKTSERLSRLLVQTDKVLAEIEADNPQAVVVFAEMVADELQTEHKQWTDNLDATGQLQARLEQRLRDAQASSNRQAAAAGPAPSAPALSLTARVVVKADAGTFSEIAASAAQWQQILSAAAVVLPPPQGDRARALLDQLVAVTAPLNSGSPASSTIAAAQVLIGQLEGDNPIGSWFAAVAPKLAAGLGTVLPPLGMALGIAEIGAKLGEAAYRRWVASVLEAPFSPGLIQPADTTSTDVMAAMEVSPVFAQAWSTERAAGNMAALTDMGQKLLADPEQLWDAETVRFGNDRAKFDQGVKEMHAGMLHNAVSTDLAGAPEAAKIVTAARTLNADDGARPALNTLVELTHELRNAGVDVPAIALRLALTGALKS